MKTFPFNEQQKKFKLAKFNRQQSKTLIIKESFYDNLKLLPNIRLNIEQIFVAKFIFY